MSDTLKVTVGEGDDAKTFDISPDKIQAPEGYRVLTLKEGETPAGYVKSEYMKQELERRGESFKGMVKPDDLLSDTEFLKKINQRHGIELGEDLKPKSRIDPQQIQSMREQWRNEEYVPVANEVETLRGKLKERDLNDLRYDLERAMNADMTRVRKDLRISLTPGKPPPIVDQLLSMYKQDENGFYFFPDEHGNPIFADKAVNGDPYAKGAKLLQVLKAQGVDIFEHTGPQATPLGQTNGRATSTDTRKWADLPRAERMKFIAEHGHEAVKERLLAEKGQS